MGNCFLKPKKRKRRKNRNIPVIWAQKCSPKQTNPSEVLSLSSTSSFNASQGSDEELKMLEIMSTSDVDNTSVRTFIIEREGSTLDELAVVEEKTPKADSPVAFQLTYGRKTMTMPQRLASRMESRMDKKRLEMLKLTEEDEQFMDEIVEEYDYQKGYLEFVLSKKRAAEIRREKHLERIREKARDMSYGPQSRVMKFEGVGDEGMGRGERG